MVAGLASFALGLVPPPPVADAPAAAWNLLTIPTYAAAATLLVFGGRRDRRAVYLGGLYLLIAATFADFPVEGIVRVLPIDAGTLFETVIGAEIEAFVPLLIWLFARDFPAAPSSPRLTRAIRLGIQISVLSGVLLFAVNIALALTPLTGVTLEAFEFASRQEALFTRWLLALAIAALPPIILKARVARPTEKRRVGLFAAALALGLGPVCLALLGEALSPAFRRMVTAPSVQPVYDVCIYLLLLSVPLTTTYAVLVDQVLDVTLVIRKALQYALTRYSVLLLTSVPFVGLALLLYRHRSDTLTALVAGPRPLALLGLCVLGLVALLMRRPLLDAIDRRFFRERFDARGLLTTLVERTRRATTVRELAGLITREIDRALHVDAIAVLVRDPSGRMLIAPDGSRRPLPTSWTLARLAAASAEPLDVDLEHPRSAFRRLPGEEREWLSDAASRLLVPLLERDGTLIGLMTLGEKRSELPFDRDDRELLTALAAAGALTLENLSLRAQTPRLDSVATGSQDGMAAGDRQLSARGDEVAAECPQCRNFHAPGTERCPLCAASLVPASVPYTLAGKFRFQSQLGAGGMGVVYLATDLALERSVAIKTLPRVSPEDAMRLRREARVAASVSHPNLAMVFGIETWRGIPMLVFEFVQAGTLADRLGYGKLPPDAVIPMGLTLASVLNRAHDAGVIHGDIKPSNIGFQRDDTIKLLDFGVARLLGDRGFPVSREALLAPDADTRPTGELSVPDSGTTTRLFGTPAYLSPEALRGDPPDPTFDLWSLALVMYESLTGRNPMISSTVLETVRMISRAQAAGRPRRLSGLPAGARELPDARAVEESIRSTRQCQGIRSPVADDRRRESFRRPPVISSAPYTPTSQRGGAMPGYTAEQLFGQAFVAFGQGTGPVRVHSETITAIRARYQHFLSVALEHWEEDAPQALERVRATGRTAAFLAIQAGQTAIGPEDFRRAAELVEDSDFRLRGARTRICQVRPPQS